MIKTLSIGKYYGDSVGSALVSTSRFSDYNAHILINRNQELRGRNKELSTVWTRRTGWVELSGRCSKCKAPTALNLIVTLVATEAAFRLKDCQGRR